MDEIPMVREGNHLVPVDQMSSEELARVPLKTQVMVKITQPHNLRQFRLAWVLATKVAEACDWLHDRDDAMDWLKIKARHVRYIHDHHNKETAIIPKSIRWAALDQQGFDRIFKRMVFVTITEIIPGLDESALLAEIESLVGIEPTPPVPAKPKRRRATAEQRTARNVAAAEGKLPPPVSVIPPHDPDTGEVIDVPPAETFPGDTPLPTERKETRPKETVKAPPAPIPVAETAARVPLPKTVDEWKEYCKTWLDAASEDESMDDQAVMQRWNSERSLRNECGVTFDDRAKIFEYYEAILDLKKEHR